MRFLTYFLLLGCLPLFSVDLSANTFVGGFEGNIWTDYRNWSDQQVPGAGDVAVIPEDHGVTINGAITVGSLILAGGINNNAQPNASLTIVASFSWTSGSVAAPVYLLQGCAGLWQGGLGMSANITNYGQVTCDAGITLSNCSIINYGELDVVGAHNFGVYYSPASVENHGLLKKPIVDPSTFSIGILLLNHPDGDILVENGELFASIHCQQYGDVTALAGGTFRTHTLQVYDNATFTGPGKLNISGNGATAENSNMVTFDIGEVEMNANIGGSGQFTFTQQFVLHAGGIGIRAIFSTTCTVDVDAGGGGITNDCTNNGTFNINAQLTFSYGSLTNNGTISLTGPYGIGIYAATAGIFNHGTVQKPAGSPGVFNMGVPLTNHTDGQVLVDGNEFFISSNFYNSGLTHISAGATFRTNNSTTYNGSVISGEGLYVIAYNGLTAQNTDPISIDVAEVELNGQVNGSGVVNFVHHVSWNSSSLQTVVNFGAGSVVDMNPGASGISGTTTNYGVLNINTSFTLSAGQIVNHGLISLNGPHLIGIYYGTPGIFNDGTVKKTVGSSGIYDMNVPLTNYLGGSVIVEGGELHVGSTFTNAGSLSISAGATFRADNTVVQDGASFTGSGTYVMSYNGLTTENTVDVPFDIAEVEWAASLNGNGPLTFLHHVLWTNANVFAAVTIAPGAVLDLTTNGTHAIGGNTTLTNNGTMNVSTNFGGGTVQNNGMLAFDPGFGTNATIQNTGALVTHPGGDVTVNILNNSGTVQVLGDHLYLNGLVNAGSIDIPASSNVQLNDYYNNSFEAGASLTGAGTFTLSAPLSANADASINVQTFVLAATYYGISGTGSLTFSHDVEWQSGSIGNTVIIATEGVMNLSGTDFKNLSGTLTNHGTVNCDADLDFYFTAVVNNTGTFHLTNGGQFGSYYYVAGEFHNSGTLNKTSEGSLLFNCFLDNQTGGSLSVDNGTMEVGKLDNAGAVTIASGATLTVKDGSNLAGGTVTGSGILRIAGNGWNLANTLTVDAFSLEIAGNLNGEPGATLEVQGSTTWLSGTLSVPVNIAASGSFNTEGYGSKYMAAIVTNNGTFNSNTSWYTDADIHNNGNFFIGENGGFSNYSNKTFTNSSTGLLKVLPNPYGVYVYIQTVNNGTLEVADAALYFDGNFENNATIVVSSGGTLSLGGMAIFNAGTTLNAEGTLIITNSLTLNVPVVFSGVKFILSGDLSGPNDLTINTDMEWQNGHIQTDVTIITGATLEIGGGGGGNSSKQASGSQQTSSSSYGQTLSAIITNNGTTTQEGTYDMDNGTFANNGLLSTDYGGIYNGGDGGTLTNDGSWEINGSFACYVDAINNGTMSGNGELTFEPELANNGTVSPGFSPGQLDFAHNYQNGVQLNMEVENTNGPGNGHDYIEADETLLLGGALTVTETGTPLNGTYTILHCNGGSGCRTGEFASVSLPTGYVLSYTGESVILTKGQPAAVSPSDTTVCTGNPVTLTASEGESYTWSTGETTQSIEVYPYNETTYYVTVTYPGGGGALGSATVHIAASPSVYVDPSYSYLCQGESVTLSTYGDPGTYAWTFGETTASITVSPAETTSYQVTVTNAAGCIGVGYAYVEVGGAAVTPNITGIPASICQSESPIELPYYQDGYYGEWSGPGVTYNSFDPAGLSGDQTLTFNPYGGQCATTAAWVITVTVSATYYADADGDGYGNPDMSQTSCTQPAGYVALGNDCNDDNAGIHPGVAEICNGLDDNCDGVVDEGDICDGDGDGYTTGQGDCDDSNASIHPGATEICNNLDDDCDGLIDENVGATWYADADGDGYGDAAVTQNACTQPAGYVNNTNDCNDGNSAVHPGAPEICNNIDDDCDGQVDESNLNLTLAAGNILCHGGTTTLTATATGGTAPYQYSLDGGPFGTTNSFPVPSGNHFVTVKDANNCQGTNTYFVEQPASLNIDPVVVTHIVCAGGNTGAIDITVSGGTGNRTYHWSNNKTTQDIINLAANTYTVTVSDANACTATISATVNPKLALTASKTNTTCNGGSDGTATANPTGGTPGYTYLWSNGATDQTIENLAPGTYTVTATDALGCTRTKAVSVGQPAAIGVSGTVQNVTCNGSANGSIDISHTNGIAPFTYAWSDGATTMDRSTIGPGTYTVTVTDVNGCSKSKSFTVSQPTALTISLSAQNVTCNGAANGSITATAAGGTKFPTSNTCNGERYCYVWSNGATTKALTGLAPGTYTVVITDLNGCTVSASATITQPDALEITDVVIAPLSNGKYAVIVMAAGGTPAYKYKRTPGSSGYQTSNLFNNVPAGTYDITVRDAKLCETTLTVAVPGSARPSGASPLIEVADDGSAATDGRTMLVYPNPATDEVNVQLDAEFVSANLRVFDVQGKLMVEQRFEDNAPMRLQVADWKPGLYFVQLLADGERWSQRLNVGH